MNVAVTVNSTGFDAMLNELRRMSGNTYPNILKAEAARVIEKAIAFTPAAKAGDLAEAKAKTKINAWPENAFPQVFRGQYGNMWMAEKSDEFVDPRRPRESSPPHLHIMNDQRRRWNPKRWAKFKQLEAERAIAIEKEKVAAKKALKKARGLSKNSWYQIAVELGLQLRNIPQYVKNALASDGTHYINGSGRQFSKASGDFFLELTNKYPALTRGVFIKKNTATMNGHAILQRAIKARLSAFAHEMKKGVFNDLKLRASRHPGVFVKP